VLARLRDYPVDVYWFGATSKGEAGQYSDIDVAILPQKPLSAGLLAEIREALVNRVMSSIMSMSWIFRKLRRSCATVSEKRESGGAIETTLGISPQGAGNTQ